MNKIHDPLTIVIFGSTGDLYQNKLATALCNLFATGIMPENLSIIGFGRRALSDLDFQNFTRDAILAKNKNTNMETLGMFLSHVKYFQGDLEDIESYKRLSMKLGEDDASKGACSNKLFYLAVPPTLYGSIFQNIAGAGISVPCAPSMEGSQGAWTRLLVEKPFGNDLADAERLDKMLGELFDESQIFRIDHYLAYLFRGVVENISNLRFGPGSIGWNKENVQNVKVIFHEKDLVGKRGVFYDALGAFRDVGQNHMLQMLALVAMDNPQDAASGGLHKSRARVLENLQISDQDAIVHGQYEGYLSESGVRAGSETETFFRVTLFVNHSQWEGVPFILEFGKALNESKVSIEVCFKESKTCVDFPVSDEDTLRDAYDKVFYDSIVGDRTIFVSTDEILAEWALTTEIIKKWGPRPLVIYKQGSRAEEII